MSVAAILLNWQRPENVREIIPALRAQSVEPHIILVDNSTVEFRYRPETAEQNPDEYWRMRPINTGPFVRFLAAYNASAEWLYFQDDDLAPRDDEFISDMIKMGARIPDVITGVFGRHVFRDPPHYLHADTDGATNMVKTRCMVMRRETLGRVRFPPDKARMARADDLWVSLESSAGEPVHWTDRRLAERLTELSEHGVGISNHKHHYHQREQFCAWWWEQHMEGD